MAQTMKMINLRTKPIDARGQSVTGEGLDMGREVHGESAEGVGGSNRAAGEKRFLQVLDKGRRRDIVWQR